MTDPADSIADSLAIGALSASWPDLGILLFGKRIFARTKDQKASVPCETRLKRISTADGILHYPYIV